MEDPLSAQIRAWSEQWNKVDRLYNEWAQRQGVTSSVLFTLSALHIHGPLTQSLIAQRTALPKQTVSNVVKSLEGRRLVRTAVDPVDRRSRSVELTEEGAQLAHRLYASMTAIERSAFGELSTEDRSTFIRINTQLTLHLERLLKSNDE